MAWEILHENGFNALWVRTKRFLAKSLLGRTQLRLPVDSENILAADWTKPEPSPRLGRKPPFTINIVTCPPTQVNGGSATLFYIVRHLERSGHRCRIYIYDPLSTQSLKEWRDITQKKFPPMKSQIYDYRDGMESCDAVMATTWQSAYPVFNFKTDARKFYFVQDFEPAFFPAGSLSALAENTYRFGFYGITAGRWLAEKLRQDYQMPSDFFDFGSGSDRYSYKNVGPRHGIVFFARPTTERRGFELGVLTLELFAKDHPEFQIELVGADVRGWRLPFKFTSRGILSHEELDRLYNRCSAGLVLSLTNFSLMPLEMISAGCIPVVNDGPNNRMVSNNAFIEYAEPSPHSLARALGKVVSRKDLTEYAKKASDSVKQQNWSQAGAKVEAIITRELNG